MYGGLGDGGAMDAPGWTSGGAYVVGLRFTVVKSTWLVIN